MEPNNNHPVDHNSGATTNEPSRVYTGPKACNTGEGLTWLSEGFTFFKGQPGDWVITMIVGFIIMIIIQFLPVISFIVGSLTTCIWSGGLMLGCHAQRTGKGFNVDHLFAGFKSHFVPLVTLSGVYSITSYAIMYIAMGSELFTSISNGELGPAMLESSEFWLRLSLGIVLLTPLLMCIWFAPVLIVVQNMSVKEAVIESYRGCTKNILPFLVYGLILVLLYVVAIMPLLLGLLVLGPTVYGSIYASYEAIYTAQNSENVVSSMEA